MTTWPGDGFNGAVDDRRRRPRQPAGARRAEVSASMGPSMIVDGDTQARLAAAKEIEASMGPSMIVDGDTMLSCTAPDGGAYASMGPSMIVDGDRPLGVRGQRRAFQASMGPS